MLKAILEFTLNHSFSPELAKELAENVELRVRKARHDIWRKEKKGFKIWVLFFTWLMICKLFIAPAYGTGWWFLFGTAWAFFLLVHYLQAQLGIGGPMVPGKWLRRRWTQNPEPTEDATHKVDGYITPLYLSAQFVAWASFTAVYLLAIPAPVKWLYAVTMIAGGGWGWSTYAGPRLPKIARVLLWYIMGGIAALNAAVQVFVYLGGKAGATTSGIGIALSSTPSAPSWLGTAVMVALAIIVGLVVLRVLLGLLKTVVPEVGSLIKTVIWAVVAIIIALLFFGAIRGIATARPTSGYSAPASAQDSAGVLSTPEAQVAKTEPNSWKVILPANREWLPTGIKGKISGTASGQANAGAGNPQATPAGASERVMSAWNGHPYLMPNVPEGTLLGRDGPNGSPFILGSSFLGVNVSDQLFVAFNDAAGTFGNNEGAYTLTITTN